MKANKFYSALLSVAMLFSTATFYACHKDDDSKPDTPVSPVNPDNPEKHATPTKADELAQNIKALAESSKAGEPVLLELDANTTADDFKTITDALSQNSGVNVSLDFSKTGIADIPDDAFKEVKNLAEVVLPSKTKSIGANAFKDCKGLQYVVFEKKLSKSDPVSDFKIGASAFNGCAELDSVIVPYENISVDPSAFEKTQISVLADGKFVSFKDALYAANVHILAHVSEIPKEAFYYQFETEITREDGSTLTETKFNETLKSVSFADGINLTSIGETAFGWCSEATIAKIPNGVKYIGAFALGHVDLIDKTIPESVEEIGESAFIGVVMGDNFEIPSTIKKIGYQAFYWSFGPKYSGNFLHVSVRTYDGKAVMADIPFDIETLVIPSNWIEIPFLLGWNGGTWSNLKDIVFEDNCRIEKLLDYQFVNGGQHQIEMEEFVVPASVKEIGLGIFTSQKINKVSFAEGSQIEKIDPRAFDQTVDWHTYVPEIHLPKFFELTSYEGAPVPEYVTIYVPADLVETFKAADCYKNCTIKAEE